MSGMSDIRRFATKPLWGTRSRPRRREDRFHAAAKKLTAPVSETRCGESMAIWAKEARSEAGYGTLPQGFRRGSLISSARLLRESVMGLRTITLLVLSAFATADGPAGPSG
jgi:hypothetical protein